MKTFLIAALALTAVLRASAQMTVELGLDQDQFLPNEAVRLAVKITNQSGQPVHLGEDPSWLTFSVESSSGSVVIKNSEVPVVEPFDLESSQMATKRVDLEPYFVMSKPGRYKVIATVRIKEWSATLSSAPKHFDIINGGELWGQDFGVMVSTNTSPDPRRYALIKANFLKEQLRLYLKVSSRESGQVFKVAPLGLLVSFSSPEAQVDRTSRLHVLWQTGAQTFSYVIASPEGAVISRDAYDNYNARPHLAINELGDVVVQGGVKRAKTP